MGGDDQKTLKRVRYYPTDYKDPLIVFIRVLKDPFKLLHFTKYITKTYPSTIYIKPENKQKIKLEFNNRDDANKICQDTTFKDFRVYIPAERTEVQGIIILSGDTNVDDIATLGVGKFKHPGLDVVKILDVNRNKKLDENAELITLNTVRVTFQGTVLPDYVKYMSLLIRVRPYTPRVLFCSNCLLYNHSEKYCTRKPKCDNCDGEHPSKDCEIDITSPTTCKNCESLHKTGHSDCPATTEYKKKKVQSIMKKRKQSFAILSQLGDHMPGESIETIRNNTFTPDLSNPFTHNIPKHTKSNASKKRKASDSFHTDNIDQPATSGTSKHHPNFKAPGYQKSDNDISNLVLSFCKELEIPPIILKFVELYVIPFIEKIWTKFSSKIADLLSCGQDG